MLVGYGRPLAYANIVTIADAIAQAIRTPVIKALLKKTVMTSSAFVYRLPVYSAE